MSSNFNGFAIGNRNNPYLEYAQKPAAAPSAIESAQAPLESLGTSGPSCPTGSSAGCLTPDPTMGPFGMLPGPMRAILDERVQLFLPPPCAMRIGMMRFGVRLVNNVLQNASHENPYLPKRM